MHGSPGFAEIDNLQVDAACLHEANEYWFCWPLKLFIANNITTARTARTVAIMPRYSREPCALAMIKLQTASIKKFSLESIFNEKIFYYTHD
jgi:hypothetical protein